MTCRERRQQGIPPANPRPVRVFRQDESRFGLLTIRRRRLTPRGVQPGGPGPHVCAWFYVDGAVEPTTGDRCLLEGPYLNAAMCQLGVDALAQAFPDSLPLLVLDNSGAPPTPRLHLPANVRLVFLSPSCPALNPMTRVWRDLKDDVAWQPCADRQAQPDDLRHLLRADDPATLPSLTGDPDLMEAIHALCI